MQKRSSKAKDLNMMAAAIVEQATKSGIAEKPKKNPAAVALGRLGGLKGGKARAESLSQQERLEIAKKAAQKRWHRGE